MKVFRLLVLMLCGTNALPLWAAETWYDVEIIVFAQNGNAARDISPTSPPPLAGLGRSQPIPAAGEPVASNARLAALAPQSFRLHNEAQRISSDRNYTLLLHTGWRQPGLARAQAVPVRLRVAEPGNTPDSQAARIDGTLRLITSRYLHLEADLRYSASDASQAQEFSAQSTSRSSEPLVYRLSETRRMSSRELHYLDHPLFGIIALVTPSEKR